MPKIWLQNTPSDPIDFLIGRKFPHAFFLWVENFDQGALSEEDKATLSQIEEYELQLSELDDESLQALFCQEREAAEQEAKAASEHMESQQWYNQPEASADFEYWSKAAYWDLEEAVALALGKDPKVVTRRALREITTYPTPPIMEEFENILELAKRAERFDQLFDPVAPSLFVRWANQFGIELPSELVRAVDRIGAPLKDWEQEYEKLLARHNEMVREANRKFGEMSQAAAIHSQEIDCLKEQLTQAKSDGAYSRERSSLLKLNLVMAAAKYDYRPGVRNPATGNNRGSIAADSQTLGLALDSETIRKYLLEASELFGSDLILPND